MHPIEITKAERIAEVLLQKHIEEIILNTSIYSNINYKNLAIKNALITVNHILEMLNVNEKVESVETYRQKLYTEVKQILEK